MTLKKLAWQLAIAFSYLTLIPVILGSDTTDTCSATYNTYT